MNLLKIIAGAIFNALGFLVFYKSIRTIRRKGLGDNLIDIFTGAGFVFIGLLIWFGYFS